MSDERIYGLQGKRVYVAGHRGMVGSAVARRLRDEECRVLVAGREELDLCNADQVDRWFRSNRPHAVFLCAALVGGIHANDSRPADFIHDNLVIACNVIHAACRVRVDKLLFVGSSCIYPKFAPQPIAEDALLSGPLEPTNQWYAVAKIAGIKMCQAYRRQHGADFIAAMPTNLYGPRDNFDLSSSHVLPALIAKAHHAKMTAARNLDVWGTGEPKREFLYVEDAADGLVHLMTRYSGEDIVNLGTGKDISIRDLAVLVSEVVGFDGELRFDDTMPDGTPRKLLDVSRIQALGWEAQTSLKDGISRTYDWFLRFRTALTDLRRESA